MAAQITHIVLAKKFYDQFLSNEDERKYFIGSVFPDIRYLKVIKRAQTHWRNFNFKKTKEKGSFYLGIMVHGLTDIVRNQFLFAKSVIKFSVALKLFEDQVLYPKITNWEKYVGFLNSILAEELEFNLSKDKITHWHKLLQENFSTRPSDQTRLSFLSKLGADRNYINQINKLVGKIKEQEVFSQLVEEFYDNFEVLVKQYLK